MKTILAGMIILCLGHGPATAETPDCDIDRSLSVLAVAALLTAATWDVDHDGAFSHDLADAALADVIDFGNTWGNGLVISGGSTAIFATGVLGGSERLRDLGADMMRAYALSGTVTIAIKVSVNRPRPSGSNYSFPSGHTSSAFSIVPALHHHLGWRASAPATALGVITAMGRMQDKHHYLSDVIFGAALGWAAGDLVIRSLRSDPGSGNVMLAPGVVGYSASF